MTEPSLTLRAPTATLAADVAPFAEQINSPIPAIGIAIARTMGQDGTS
jgi:hypothetical protein